MQLIKPATAPNSFRCAGALLDALPAVMWFVRRNMRRHSTAGLSVPQYRTLSVLAQLPSAALCEVAENLGGTLPTISRVISGLVRKGYVERCTCSNDRRRVTLVITKKGREIFQIARKDTQRTVSEVLQKLDVTDRRKLLEIMTLLGNLFENHLHGDKDA